MAGLTAGVIAAVHPVAGMGLFVPSMYIVRKAWQSGFSSHRLKQLSSSKKRLSSDMKAFFAFPDSRWVTGQLVDTSGAL